MLKRMNRSRSRRRPGFTLTEVLISLGIFAIGAIAVASLFPVAALLQKETADSILSQQAITNARATIEAIGLPSAPGDINTDLGGYHQTPPPIITNVDTMLVNAPLEISGTFTGVSPSQLIDSSTFSNRYPLDTRSYPATETDLGSRDYYWYLLVRDLDGDPVTEDWVVYLLVIEKKSNQTLTDLDDAMTFAPNASALVTGVDIEAGTPYVTEVGFTGRWSGLPGADPSGPIYYHPNGVVIEEFLFPMP